MVDTSSDVNAAIAQAVAAANEAVIRQKEFGEEVRQLQLQIMHDLESSKTETETFLGSLVRHVDSAVKSMIKQFSAEVKDIESNVDKVTTVDLPAQSSLTYHY